MTLDRRKFTQTLAAAAGPILAGCSASAPPAKVEPPKKEEVQQPEPSPPEAKIEEPPQEEPPKEDPAQEPAVLQLAQLMQQYPSEHYGEEEKEEILRQLRGNYRRGLILSAYALKNGDEPAPSFAAWRKDL